ncbi:MAG: hypothetical protein ACYTF1_27610, partial [Planctomycetota bacterium]
DYMFKLIVEVLGSTPGNYGSWQNIAAAIIVGDLPDLVIFFTTYGLLTRYYSPEKIQERETRCRKCGYILRGITEPRCPECGEKI